MTFEMPHDIRVTFSFKKVNNYVYGRHFDVFIWFVYICVHWVGHIAAWSSHLTHFNSYISVSICGNTSVNHVLYQWNLY